MTYRVGIARRADGSADAWVLDLPGCRAAGGSVDDVRALLPVVVAEHVAWLQAHGESVATDAGLSVVEEIDGRGEFVFEADKEPVGDADRERAPRRAGSAQDALTARGRPLPALVLAGRPPASSVKIDAIFPDV